MNTGTALLLLGVVYLWASQRSRLRPITPTGGAVARGGASGWSVVVPGIGAASSGGGGWSISLPGVGADSVPAPALPDGSNDVIPPGGTFGDAFGGPMPDPSLPDVLPATDPTDLITPPDYATLGDQLF